MSLFARRSSEEGPDPWLDLKIGLFFVAALLAVVGMAVGAPWLIYAAILVIVLGLLLRLLPRGGGEGEQGKE